MGAFSASVCVRVCAYACAYACSYEGAWEPSPTPCESEEGSRSLREWSKLSKFRKDALPVNKEETASERKGERECESARTRASERVGNGQREIVRQMGLLGEREREEKESKRRV